MRCNVCQTTNDQGSRFCVRCGTTLDEIVAPTDSFARPAASPDPLWAPTDPSIASEPVWADSEVAVAAPVAEQQPTTPMPLAVGRAVGSSAGTYPTPGEIRQTIAGSLAGRRRRRRRFVIVAISATAVVAIAAALAITLGADSETASGTEPSGEALTTTTVAPAPTPLTSVVSVTPTVGATVVVTTTASTASPTTASPTTVPVTSIAVTTVPVTTVPVTSIAVTTVPVTTVPVTSIAVTTVPVTTVPATSATTATTNPASTAPSSTSPSSPTAGDLGLSTSISRPPCDGKFITLIGSSVDTPGVDDRIEGLLDEYPGSKYLKTALVCGSLSPKSNNGNDLYVVFFGPFANLADACAARADGTKDAYVKVLEDTDAPVGAERCT